MPARRDYYEVLGLPRGASQEEIQRAYRGLARRYHPDINKDPGAEDRFKEITEAYDVLSDPGTRARYDRFGHDWRQVPGGFDPGARPGGPRVRVDTGGGVPDIDLGDLFGDLFGGFGRGYGQGYGRREGQGYGAGPVPGADAEAEIELSVADAYAGGRRQIALDTAAGSRAYQVDIPAGVTDGQRIRLARQGGQGAGGAPPGDLYLVVRLARDPRYRVDGRDLTVDLPVTPWEAALGTSVPLDTPGGRVQVDLPAGSSSGRRLRLAGRGLPNPRGSPGDLYAEVKVVVPATLTAAERDLFERLGKESDFDPRSGYPGPAYRGGSRWRH